MRRSLVALFASVALLAMLLPSQVLAASPKLDGAKEAKFEKGGVFIVQMIDAPVVAYEGGVKGLKATAPGQGKKIDPNSTDVTRYAGYLNGKHDAAIAKSGGTKLYGYVFAFNGFAARLTAAQASKLAVTDGVVAVTPDEKKSLDTSSTPDFLGLTASGGLWEQLGGVGAGGKKTDGPGEGVVVGIVDSGIWPEHPSVSDRDANGKLVFQQLPGWHGKCVPGEEFNASLCNQKLIGAQYYNSGWGGNVGIDQQFPYEYNSPRDFDGHGTHTATTAAGNYGVAATGPAEVFGTISGMAPRARVAAYKVCWGTGDEGGCFNSDSIAAIDQAVADGVDVINFSISGTSTNFADPVEIAFLFAARAGVFVAASAGNAGPASSTVAHPSPWITTVAAASHNRNGNGSVTLGNGSTYAGASVATAVGPAPFIDSTTAGMAGADPAEVALCYPGTLDPAVVTDKIVLCDRGVIARVDKSLAVAEAGGVGMVLVNTSASSLNADFHFVPTVHLSHTDRAAVKAYAATSGATATINEATIVYDAVAPITASFSSRGPLRAAGGDLLKPDVSAPGVDVLAGVAPPGNADRLFDLYSGTSMSSPHVAGLAALFKDLHPDWSPMAIKSALMTTGTDVLDGGSPAPNTNPVLIFRQGAGHVAPNAAADPGLVFDAGWNGWLAFLCGTSSLVGAGTCAALEGLGYSTDPSDMNVASIAIGDLAGLQTVTRTVTNVSGGTHTYTASVTGMSGITVAVAPSTLTLGPGESGDFTVTFTRTTAALDAYVGGQLTWTHGPHAVRIPMVVRPVAIAAPAEVGGTGAEGSLSFDVTFGFDGAYTAGTHGLNPASTFEGNVPDDPGDSFEPGGPGTISYDVAIPAGTAYARFALFDDFTDGNDDLDLYVYRGSTLVGASGSGTSTEEVNLVLPAADTYTVWVHGWQTDGPDSDFTLFSWQIGLVDDAGNMTVTAPTSAVTAETGAIDVSWTGLDPAQKYLGAVSHSGPSGLLGLTVVAIN